MRKKALYSLMSIVSLPAFCVSRFPKPDFESGYQYPSIVHPVPDEQLWNVLDIVLLVAMMSVVAWAVHKRRSRKAIFTVSVLSVGYFGFLRYGCVCSVGAVQNVALAFADATYNLPLSVLLLFLLPIVFTLLFGRVYCAGVCPLGALQEVVNIKNLRISRAVSQALRVIPWLYLGFAILYAATRSQFLICQFDPFIAIFRLGGDIGMIVFGVALLLLSLFVPRPFCQYLCPYGALLSVFGKFAIKKIEVSPRSCINCSLCHNSCPVDALRPPYVSKRERDTNAEVRKLIVCVLAVPLLVVAGALLLGQNSDNLSRANKDVRLLEMLTRYDESRDEADFTKEVKVFHERGGSIEQLAADVAAVKRQFKLLSYIVGALMGLAIGLKILRLSTKRMRRTYEIDYSDCVACGKCFDYCPQNRKRGSI